MKINPSRLLFFSLVFLFMFAGCSTGSGNKSSSNGNTCTSSSNCSKGYICQSEQYVAQNNNSCTSNTQWLTTQLVDGPLYFSSPN